MRILFDENFPADFAALLVGHEASNVHSHGWAGINFPKNDPEWGVMGVVALKPSTVTGMTFWRLLSAISYSHQASGMETT